MNFGAYEYRPGRWQLYFTHEGKQVHLQTYEDGSPLTSKSCCLVLKMQIERHGYHPERFGKDKSFQFEQAIKTWIKLSNISPEWLDQRRQISNRFFVPYFGKKDIRDIKSVHIQEFYVHLKSKTYSDKYLDNLMSELKTFFRFYRKDLKEIPDFPKITIQESPIRWLTAEEQDQIFRLIPQQDLPIFIFMRTYGTRTNEASGLLKQNVYLDHDPPYVILQNVLGANGKLKPTTKTKRIKVLPILPEIEWIFKNGSDGDFVFSKYGGRPYTNRMLNLLWNRANEKSGVVKINLYNAMRHSFGCQRLNQGFSLDKVKEVLGHTDIRTTERYAKYSLKSLEDIIRAGSIYKPFISSPDMKLIENKGSKRLGGKDSNLG